MEFDSGNSWKLLQDNDGKKTLKITNASLENTGIYRCISKYVVRKTFVLEIDAVTYEWPPPKVISVIPNENVIHVNNHLTINCSVSSKSPLKILWFKECWTTMCEIDFAIYKIEIGQDYNCLCLINDNSNNSTYNWENLYISKLHIFNARIWDGGTYVCSALSSNGKDYKNVTITVEELKIQNSKVGRKSYLILLFIPMVLILLYVTSYLCCTKQKKNHDDSKNLNHLLSPTHVIPRK
ncbi:hypothetical protein HHI36_007840 [Cryptolaemus montrouzieri]|uniref:Ig-like domain-containing protein n=1 Tax=Cryptolaemus montrouzieri TaxID=559131 RepID=A0ABD2MQW0_9CUCU